MTISTEPFWGSIDSNVDWCEPNYAITPYIAEFFNTISSIPISGFAVIGLLYSRHYGSTELRYSFAYIAVIIVGLGSVLFHGTLRRFAQACDELPMLYAVYMLTYITHDNKHLLPYNNLSTQNSVLTRQKLQRKLLLKILLITAAIGFTVVYYVLEELYGLFLVGFVSAVLYLIITTHLTIRSTTTPVLQYNDKNKSINNKLYHNKYVDFITTQHIYNWAVIWYTIASVFWITENALCQHLPTWAYFHALWHIFSGLATYYSIQAQFAWRAALYDRVHHVKYLYGYLPYVYIEPVQLDHIRID